MATNFGSSIGTENKLAHYKTIWGGATSRLSSAIYAQPHLFKLKPGGSASLLAQARYRIVRVLSHQLDEAVIV